MKRCRALALTAGGLTVGCVQAAGAQSAPLKIAAVPIDASAEPFYANDAGFFTRAGIDATFVGGDTGPAIAAGVAAGATDVGVSNTASLVQARARGLPFVIIAPRSKYSKQPDDAVRTMQRSEWSLRLDSRELQPVIDVTAKYGNVARFEAQAMLYRAG